MFFKTLFIFILVTLFLNSKISYAQQVISSDTLSPVTATGGDFTVNSGVTISANAANPVVSVSNKNVKFADAMSNITKKKESLDDKPSDKKNTTGDNFTKNNPHPSIIRTNAKSDVDDVMERTNALLNASNKNNKASTEMTDLDKSILDKVSLNADTDDNEKSDD